MTNPLFVDVKEAARLTSFCPATIYNLCAEGKLAFSKVGRRRLIHFDSLTKLGQPETEVA